MKLADLMDGVCREFKAERSHMVGHTRLKPLAPARQAFYWLAYSRGDWSSTQIARFCQRDHSTILQGIDMAVKRMAKDPMYAKRIEALRAEICVNG